MLAVAPTLGFAILCSLQRSGREEKGKERGREGKESGEGRGGERKEKEERERGGTVG